MLYFTSNLTLSLSSLSHSHSRGPYLAIPVYGRSRVARGLKFNDKFCVDLELFKKLQLNADLLLI